MSDVLEERKKAAGRAFFSRCEEILGVEGPAALARVTRRSKAWWSKLHGGKGGRFPDWSEVAEEILLPETAPEVREALRQRHREAWLILHDPELLSVESLSVSSALTLEHLKAASGLAERAVRDGDYGVALLGLGLLEVLLSTDNVRSLNTEQRGVLGECLISRSICHCELGNYCAAIEAAQKALTCLNEVDFPELYARAIHQQGLSYYRAGRWEEALREIRRADRHYRQLGLSAEMFRAQRDAAEVLIELGRAREAEPELVRLLRIAEELGPIHRYPTLLRLVRCCVVLQDGSSARIWLESADRLAAQYPEELGEYLQRNPLWEVRTSLEARVHALE